MGQVPRERTKHFQKSSIKKLLLRITSAFISCEYMVIKDIIHSIKNFFAASNKSILITHTSSIILKTSTIDTACLCWDDKGSQSCMSPKLTTPWTSSSVHLKVSSMYNYFSKCQTCTWATPWPNIAPSFYVRSWRDPLLPHSLYVVLWR